MPDSHISSTTTEQNWAQLSLIPHEVIEVTLRIGIVPETDHLQWQVRVEDPSASTLLGLRSAPATTASRWQVELQRIVRVLEECIGAHVHPF